jgi:hypothetical protein
MAALLLLALVASITTAVDGEGYYALAVRFGRGEAASREAGVGLLAREVFARLGARGRGAGPAPAARRGRDAAVPGRRGAGPPPDGRAGGAGSPDGATDRAAGPEGAGGVHARGVRLERASVELRR